MRIHGNSQGYSMWISACETNDWRQGNWPCSSIGGSRIFVSVDDNGLCGISIDGKDNVNIDGNELDAIISDFLPKSFHHLWPVWGQK